MAERDVERRRHHLIRGLVGDREHLFHTSAEFHAAIVTLADLLPAWVDGLAAEAERFDAARDEAIRRITSWPTTPSGSIGYKPPATDLPPGIRGSRRT